MFHEKNVSRYIYNTHSALLLLSLLFSSTALLGQHDCDVMTHDTDKFTGKRSIHTPRPEWVTYYKDFDKGGSYYSIYLRAFGPTPSVRKRGVTILLKGGKRISRPMVNIDVEATSDAYEYTAMFRLASTEIALLKTYKIDDFRLYIYDSEIEEIDRDRYTDWFNCLLLEK